MTFHADTVGSYLRPEFLLAARERKVKGEITSEQLFEIENEAVKEHVQKQVAAGLKVVTDGEFRRDNYIVDFTAGLKGVVGLNPFDERLKKQQNPNFLTERGSHNIYFAALPHVEGKIASNPNHPEYAAFQYLKSVSPLGIVPKVIIPSPLFLTIMRRDDDPYPKSAYTNADEFHKDISQAYRETILHFYELGARLIQIDEPAVTIWSYTQGLTREDQISNMKKNTAQFHKLIIPVVTGLPEDLKIVYHLCRANGSTHFNVPYTYHDLIPIFGGVRPPPAYLLLEWDDERSGSVEVLKEFDTALPTTNFFLGFVTTKNTIVEKEEEITKKVNEAAKYVPLSRLGVCTQCGFGTMKEGQPTTFDAQWGKVTLLGTLGKNIWGDK